MNKMVYVFYGLNDFLIKQEVDKLREGIDPLNFVKYDLENTYLTDIIMDADLENLFGDKKDKKKYLTYSFVVGIIYDLLYTNLLFLNGLIFLVLGLLITVLYQNIGNNYLKIINKSSKLFNSII